MNEVGDVQITIDSDATTSAPPVVQQRDCSALLVDFVLRYHDAPEMASGGRFGVFWSRRLNSSNRPSPNWVHETSGCLANSHSVGMAKADAAAKDTWWILVRCRSWRIRNGSLATSFTVWRTCLTTWSRPSEVLTATLPARVGESFAISAKPMLCQIGRMTFHPRSVSTEVNPSNSSLVHFFLTLKNDGLRITIPKSVIDRPSSILARRLSPKRNEYSSYHTANPPVTNASARGLAMVSLSSEAWLMKSLVSSSDIGLGGWPNVSDQATASARRC